MRISLKVTDVFYSTLNVELNTQYTNDNGTIALLNQGYGLLYNNNSTQLLLECTTTYSVIITTNVPWDKSIQLVLSLPNDNLPQGKCYLYGAYKGVEFQHALATEDYVQQQIQGAINAVY